MHNLVNAYNELSELYLLVHIGLGARKPVFGSLRTTKAQTSLRIRTVSCRAATLDVFDLAESKVAVELYSNLTSHVVPFYFKRKNSLQVTLQPFRFLFTYTNKAINMVPVTFVTKSRQSVNVCYVYGFSD